MLRPSIRRARPLRRRLRMQTLEDRAVLAGDMDVYTAGGNLFIFGDSAANQIQLTRDGSGQVTISALDDTKLNGGDDDVTLTVTRGIFIFTRGGDDVVRLMADDGTATGGDASDAFFVNGVLHIDTAGGNDEISLSNVEVRRTMVLLTGSGNDKILVPENAQGGPSAGDTGVTARGVSVIVTGRGADEVNIVNSEFRKVSVVVTGSGADTLSVRDSDFQKRGIFVGGSGNDTITQSGNTNAKTPIVVSFENTTDTQAPTAGNDTATVNEGATTTINVISNDSDPNGSIDPDSIVITQQPANGTATVNSNGTITYVHGGGENTSDTIKYTIKDQAGNTSNVATVTITVTPVNDPPVAVADSATVAEGGTVIIDVEANDTDAEGKATINQGSIVITQQPTNGSVTVNNDGTVTYVHNGGESTTDTFKYTIKDNASTPGTSNEGTVTITVTPVNDPPVAVNDAQTVNEGSTTNIDVEANDTDPEGKATINQGSIVIVTQPANGTATANADGTVTYVHGGGENTGDSFTYTIKDASGATSNVATVTITITPVNDAPVAVADTATVAEGGNVTFNVATNDTDAETSVVAASVVKVTDPAHGTLVNNGDGTFTYTHNGSETTTDSFTYTIEDTDGNVSAAGTVTITITPVNDDPVANDDSSVVATGNSVVIDLADNDTDPENDLDLTSIVITVDPTHGTIGVNPNGTITYTHNGDGATSDTFSYTIADGDGAVSNAATVTIAITATNVPPVANDDSATVAEGVSILIDLAGNDTDTEGQLLLDSIDIVTGPTNGTLTDNHDGTFTYTHDGGETTTDSFTYTIKDAQGTVSNVATVTITITPVNDDPIAVADSATVAEGGNVIIDVATNDTDAETSVVATTVVKVTDPANGTLVNNGDGTFTYTHNGGETTTDSFTYTIEDTDGNVSAAGTVNITITPVNDDPVAVNDTASVTEDDVLVASGNVLGNDTDAENDTLTVTNAGTHTTNHGSIVINADGSYVYTLDNSDALVQALNDGDTLPDFFTYSISDGNGGTDTGTLNITINGKT